MVGSLAASALALAGVRRALGAPSGAGDRARPAARALVRRRQRRRLPLRPRLLRAAAGQHPLPHRRVGLVGAARGHRGDARARSWPRSSAAVGGRLADRFGQRVVALPGGLLFAAGCLVFATGTGATPHYASEFLPATLLTGTGVGPELRGLGQRRRRRAAALALRDRQRDLARPRARSARCSASPSSSRSSARRAPSDAVSTFHTRLGAHGDPGDRRRPHRPRPRPRPRAQPGGGGGARGGGGVSAPGEIRTPASRLKGRRSNQLSYGGTAELRTRKRKWPRSHRPWHGDGSSRSGPAHCDLVHRSSPDSKPYQARRVTLASLAVRRDRTRHDLVGLAAVGHASVAGRRRRGRCSVPHVGPRGRVGPRLSGAAPAGCDRRSAAVAVGAHDLAARDLGLDERRSAVSGDAEMLAVFSPTWSNPEDHRVGLAAVDARVLDRVLSTRRSRRCRVTHAARVASDSEVRRAADVQLAAARLLEARRRIAGRTRDVMPDTMRRRRAHPWRRGGGPLVLGTGPRVPRATDAVRDAAGRKFVSVAPTSRHRDAEPTTSAASSPVLHRLTARRDLPRA